MKDRLLQIIQAKTAGNKSRFADVMGWSKQYLSRMLNVEGGIGLTPVCAVLDKYKDINARWLLLGEGDMYNSADSENLYDKAMRLVALEKYICVMSADEVQRYAAGDAFAQADIDRWQDMLDNRQRAMDYVFSRAYQNASRF